MTSGTVLIVGASRGIGPEPARQYCAAMWLYRASKAALNSVVKDASFSPDALCASRGVWPLA